MPVVAAYPNSIPSFTTKVDDVDTVFADNVNILQAEVAAIATALGTSPAGTAGTVKARIAAVEASTATVAGRFDSSGMIPQAGVVGLTALAGLFSAPGGLLPQANVYGLAAALASAAGISPTLVDAKGDLLVGTADNTVARLAVGANNLMLVADSTAAGGVSWQAVPVVIPFHLANALSTGVKAPMWIAPRAGTLNFARARAASGSGAIFQVYLNGASVTADSAAVAQAVVLHDFADVNFNAGDYVQIFVSAAGSAADMSVTIQAVWR